MSKWDLIGIPHKGWECIGMYDLADDSSGGEIEYEQCEMCGNEKIRYVHIMKHGNYPEELHVGCVCAEKMSDDYVNPRQNEGKLRRRASRKANFDRVEWKYNSQKQTYSKKYKGEYITIKQTRFGNWGIFFASKVYWDKNGKKIYTLEDAERYAFEVFDEHHTTKEERAFKFNMSRLGY